MKITIEHEMLAEGNNNILGHPYPYAVQYEYIYFIYIFTKLGKYIRPYICACVTQSVCNSHILCLLEQYYCMQQTWSLLLTGSSLSFQHMCKCNHKLCFTAETDINKTFWYDT